MKNIIASKRVLNFKFRTCKKTGDTIWPFTYAWHCWYMNYGGAIIGAPPQKMDYWLSDKAYTLVKLTNDPL